MRKISFLITCLFTFCVAATAQTLPGVSFVGASRTVAESAGTVVINLSLSTTVASPASVQVFVSSGNATNNVDYALIGTTVTFPANSTAPQSVTLTLTDDASAEADEFIFLRLQNLTGVQAGATPTHLVHIVDNDKATPTPSGALSLSLLTSYRNPTAGSSEIIAYDKDSRRLFIANSVGRRLNIVNFTNPSAPVSITAIDISPLGNINSVAVRNGIVAVALEGLNPQANGTIAFYDINGVLQKQVTAGAMPDMIAFSPNGRYVVTPNEGEPNSYSTTGVDPEGSVTIVDISGGIAGLTQANVTTVGFTALNDQREALRAAGVRFYGRAGNVANGSTVAQDLEPEYAAFTPDSRFAYITLQENNALVVIDLDAKALAPNPIRPLGLKNHNLDTNAFDPTDQGGALTLQKQPVFGMYEPDAIASFVTGGQTYFVTANEGDAREYTGLVEEVRVGAAGYVLDPTTFPNAVDLKNNQLLGRLTVTNATGDTDGDGDFDQIHVLGGRSFSIRDINGALVYDSGDDFERYTRANFPVLFNATNENSVAAKNRSDNKGPEPEGITTATIGGREYAFITLERIGGVMVYDVTNPSAPQLVTYAINRGNVPNAATDDLGPEGIIYLSAADSPNGQALVLLANEVSNSVSVFQITTPPSSALAIQTPLYDCTTRQITFQSNGGNGAPVEYRAVGVTDWTTNPVAFIEAGVVGDQNNSSITLMARQAGSAPVSQVFNFRQFCAGVTPPTQPGALTLLAPAYNCSTRQITFATTVGDGSVVEYMAVGVTGWTTNPVAFIEPGVVIDQNNSTVTLMARQNGVVISRDFNFRQACAPARLASPETATPLAIRVLGNPTLNESVSVEILGAGDQPLVLNVVNELGFSVETQFVERASTTERRTLRLGRVPGLYLIQAHTPAAGYTVKVMKQ